MSNTPYELRIESESKRNEIERKIEGIFDKPRTVTTRGNYRLKKDFTFTFPAEEGDIDYKSSDLVIIHDFDLANAVVTLTEGSSLINSGGIVRNGTIIGDKTKIDTGVLQLFENVNLEGTWDLEKINPKMFGALKGGDLRDDSIAIQKAIDLANLTGAKVDVTDTGYILRNPIIITKPIDVIGAGANNTVINVVGDIYGIIIGAPSNSYRGGSLKGVLLLGDGFAKAGIRLGHDSQFTNQPVNFTLDDVHTVGFVSPDVIHSTRIDDYVTNPLTVTVVDGIDVYGTEVKGATGILDTSSQGFTFNRVYSYGNYYGYFEASNNQSTTHQFKNCFFRINRKIGFFAYAPISFAFYGCIMESNDYEGIVFGGTELYEGSPRGTVFYSPHFENNNVVGGNYEAIFTAHEVNSQPSIDIYSPVINMRNGDGILINKGRNCLIENPRSGDSTVICIKTTNSTNVRINGGKDDNIFDLDDNTLHIKNNVNDGGLQEIDGRLKFKVGKTPELIRADGTIISDAIVVTTTAVITEEILKTYILKGGTFQGKGHGLKITIFGAFGGGGTAKTIKLKFGGVIIFQNITSPIPENNAVFKLEVTLMYQLGNDIYAYSEGVIGSVQQKMQFIVLNPIDVTTDHTIEFTGQNSVANINDIIIRNINIQTINYHL